MIKKLYIALLGTALLGASSCMKDEPLNAECDIEMVTLHCASPSEVFFNLSDSTKKVLCSDSTIVFEVRHKAPLEQVVPELKVTAGATVQLLSGASTDFSEEHTARYRVTSQDGNWHRDYTISVIPAAPSVISDVVKYDFEVFELEAKTGKYYVWHNERLDGTMGDEWATGNPGFKLSMSSALPEQYPTVPCDGIDGKALCLTTRDTGPFGVWANKRLAAGNFFLGEFNVEDALKDAMRATRFGVPFNMKPVKMEGYYKFTPGAKMQDRYGKEIVGEVDKPQVYAVLYLNTDEQGNSVMLHGDDVLTNPNIVAIAKVPELPATTEWTAFAVDFEFYKDVDDELLRNKGYNLTIVFSSSARGADFEGAIGSELCIDKVRLTCTKLEE